MGDNQTAAPAGPYIAVPLEFFLYSFGGSLIENVFHSFFPVTASSDATLPRNLQHSYFGLGPDTSSIDEIGTYNRFW